MLMINSEVQWIRCSGTRTPPKQLIQALNLLIKMIKKRIIQTKIIS